MEQNTEIIRSLYGEVLSFTQTGTNIKSGLNGFARYAVSANTDNLKDFEKFFMSVAEAFPNYELTIDNLLTKEDRVMVCYTISGTQSAPFLGKPPTNKGTTIRGIDVFRLNNGKVVEYWDSPHQISASIFFASS
jgi:predicted SnoaL-like aldol condensation-catalyzing enzyme